MQETNVTQISRLLAVEDIFKRLPCSNIKENFETVLQMSPELKTPLLQRVEAPLGMIFENA
jgi:hypothetical protein